MTIRNHIIGALLFLAFACMTYATTVRRQLAQSRENERALALRASNDEARRDTTRVSRPLNDSIPVYEKRVVQQPQRRDRLDAALGRQRIGEYAVRVAIESLDTRMTIVNSDSTPFHIRKEPFTVDAVVSRPRNGDSTSLDLRIALDTIPLNARIQCSTAGEGGVRAANIVATGPPWAVVRFGEDQQDPAVCNPAPRRGTERSRWLVSWAPVALSVGRQPGAGSSGWTAQIGTALTFGAR